jgi:hypothetical protein
MGEGGVDESILWLRLRLIKILLDHLKILGPLPTAE